MSLLSLSKLASAINFYAKRRFSSGVSYFASSKDPLGGIRVVDLTRIVSGPYCTMMLGDLGAEVLKIERPGTGDEARNWGPPFIEETNESCYFLAINRNKKSVCVDLKTREGRNIIYELVKKSDILVENYVPGKLDELGLGYEDLKVIAPHLIYCSMTGYGSKGPYAKRPGYDVIASSVGGLLHITGPFEGEPCKVGVAMTDIATGLYAHGAILAALLQRTKTNVGQKIDCNLMSTVISCLINVGSNYLNAGKEAKRLGTQHGSIVPYQAFETSDHCYITVGGGSDQQFKALCEKLLLPDLPLDPLFATNKMRVLNRNVLIEKLSKRFKEQTLSQWLKTLEGSTFPYGPVNSMEQDVRTVRLTLRKPKTRKAVQWTTGTVDNEHLNRKKSKCCCQYTKPKAFDESSSSSSSDEECEHCFGHVEKKKKKHSQGDTPIEECDHHHHHHHSPESPDQPNEEQQDGGCSSSSQNGEQSHVKTKRHDGNSPMK